MNSDVWLQFLQALTLENNHMRNMSCCSNVSYGWNVLKRINNNYFSSNSLLFFSNTQQLKSFFFSWEGLLQWEFSWGLTSRRGWYAYFFTGLDWDLSGRSYICRVCPQKADAAARSHYRRHFFMALWERGRNWWMALLEAQAWRKPGLRSWTWKTRLNILLGFCA